jgi:hypothetical protein
LSSSSIRDLFLAADGMPRVVRGVAVYSGSPRLAELAIRVGFDRPHSWTLDDVLAARDESFDLSASPPTWAWGKKKIELDEDTAKLVRRMLKMRKQIA